MVELPQVEKKVAENKSRITTPLHDHHHTHNKHVKAGLGIQTLLNTMIKWVSNIIYHLQKSFRGLKLW